MRVKHLFAAVALICMPAAAPAQDDRGASVSGAVSATNMDSATEFSFSGAFGYRFSRVVGFELETTVVPALKSPFPGYTILSSLPVGGFSFGSGGGGGIPVASLIYPTPRFDNPSGRMVIFSSNVRIAVPTTSTRVEPYFVAGGGIASVRRTADYFYPVYPTILTRAPEIFPLPEPRLVPNRITSSTVDMALTLGGGLSVRVARQLMVDADLRMFRLLGQDDRNAGRFGVGVRYRF